MLLTWQKFQHHTHTHTWIHKYIYIYVFTHIYTFLYVQTYTSIYACVRALLHTYFLTSLDIFVKIFNTCCLCCCSRRILQFYRFCFVNFSADLAQILENRAFWWVISNPFLPPALPVANRQSPVTSTTVVAAQVLPKCPNHNHTSQFPIRQLQQKQPNSCAAP